MIENPCGELHLGAGGRGNGVRFVNGIGMGIAGFFPRRGVRRPETFALTIHPVIYYGFPLKKHQGV